MNVAAILAIVFGEGGDGTPATPENITEGYTGIYSGNRVSLTWVITEPTMVTRIYHPDAETLFTTKNPGTSYTETGKFEADGPRFWLVHSNAGVDSETPLELGAA